MIEEPQVEFRIGIGTDIHRLVEDRKLMLCGIYVPYPMGLAGHSDADVGLHAVIDALLGASGRSRVDCTARIQRRTSGGRRSPSVARSPSRSTKRRNSRR